MTANVNIKVYQQVHFSAEDFLKPFNHFGHVEKTPACFGHKLHQDIDVTVRAKVFSQHGTEKGKLLDLPCIAEGRNFRLGNFDLDSDHLMNTLSAR